MKLVASLAWRNLWRNPRRSLLTMSSVVFAVVVALSTRSMQLGFYARTIHNVVSFYTGYLQVHARGWQESQALDDSFADPESLASVTGRVPHVTFVAPRLESFALLSSDSTTDGARIVGVDPAREDRLTGLRSRLVSGRYLAPGDEGILLGAELARHLGVAPGDTLVALGSGYHAATAAGRFVVAGTLRFPIPEMNTRMAWLDLAAAQSFYGAPDRATSLAVMLDRAGALTAAAAALRARLGPGIEVLSWKTLMPEMVQYIQLDNAGGLLMLLLVYVVIGFGILGTVLTMTLERTREFGVLVAVGMRRRQLSAVVLFESVLLALQGAVVGMLVTAPLMLALARHPIVLGGEAAAALRGYGFEPILPFSLQGSIFVSQTAMVLAIALIAAVVPLVRIRGLDPVTAMRRGV
jgi:putative ABC transport system permease protein